MGDYIIVENVDVLKPNPINSDIYEDNREQLEELKQSILNNGLLEPLTIDESNNMVISGHRRLMACKELGIKEVECRISRFENTTIATIELNRYREKTKFEIANEIRLLNSEYKKETPQGRPLKGELRNMKFSSMEKVAKSLGISLTKAKQLISIGNYEPQLLRKIDMGIISVQKAYQYCQTKYKNKDLDSKYNEKNHKTNFKRDLKKLLKRYQPSRELTDDLIDDFYND